MSNGKHTVVVCDLAGNSTSRTFIVDTVFPEIVVKKNGNILQNELFYLAITDTVSFSITETNEDSVMLNDVETTQREFLASDLDDCFGGYIRNQS